MKTIVFEKLTVIDVKEALDSIETLPVTTSTYPFVECIQHTTDSLGCG